MVTSASGRRGRGYKLEVAGTTKSGVSAVSAANQPALRISAANTAATGRITAIQQLTSEGDTRIFADYEPYVEYGMYARNSDDSIHFTAGSATNGLESWTEYNTAGTARTAYSKMKVSLGDGQVTIGGNVGIGTTGPTFKFEVSGAGSIGDGPFVVSGGGLSTSYYDQSTGAYGHPGAMVRKDNASTDPAQMNATLVLYRKKWYG